ncbi:MAG: NUDIX hydrolase [Patescibacteria group bacterium]
MKIKIIKDELVHEGKFLKTIHRHFKTQSGKKGTWEMVQRKVFHRIIGVIGITENKEIILVKIFRIPVKSFIIEPVMGLTDKKGESEIKTVKRELLEETGYVAKKFIRLTVGPHNGGLSGSETALYCALGAKKIQEPKLEISEDISVVKIPFSKISRFLAHPPKGCQIDIKVFGLLYLLKSKSFIE